jgi:2-polyprenyl-6-methoxyphenol hydroxylase-like FAD-dependent oxidoreductase
LTDTLAEQRLRDLVRGSKHAELRTECTVTSCQETDEGVEVTYTDSAGTVKHIQGRVLVGADGKRGYIRKHFLEPHGIIQETGIHSYAGTWLAANVRITLPTPQSHPDFELWSLGYASEELWDLFWPDGFHFCNHPTKPVATGRFGPTNDKYWRFEYELPEGYKTDDWEADLKREISPHITIPAKRFRNASNLNVSQVTFPWDCVEIVRCQPAL